MYVIVFNWVNKGAVTQNLSWIPVSFHEENVSGFAVTVGLGGFFLINDPYKKNEGGECLGFSRRHLNLNIEL